MDLMKRSLAPILPDAWAAIDAEAARVLRLNLAGRKLVDVDYYIDMGGTAYQQVAIRTEETRKSIFEELAHKFAAFVDVLAAVSAKTTPNKSEKDLLRLYELWVRTGSDRAAKALSEAGSIVKER